jgi:Icc-related predicted phosphoesterase
MRILLTSDLHGNLPLIESEADMLIVAGDICPDFMTSVAQHQHHWLDTEFRRWLSDLPVRKVIAIAGNHDFVMEKPYLIPDLPWHYLRDNSVTIDGIKIHGMPWVPNLPSWAFFGGFDSVDEGIQAKIPEDTDILVSHGPPYGYADKLAGGGKYGNSKAMRVGDKGMDVTLARVKPKLFVCGHIHESFGHYNHPHVEHGIWNVAFVDEIYRPRMMIPDFEWEDSTSSE